MFARPLASLALSRRVSPATCGASYYKGTRCGTPLTRRGYCTACDAFATAIHCIECNGGGELQGGPCTACEGEGTIPIVPGSGIPD